MINRKLDEYETYISAVTFVQESTIHARQGARFGQVNLQINWQMNDRTQVVVSGDVAVAEDGIQIAFDTLYKHMRVDGQYADERVVVFCEQHMHYFQYLKHFALFTTVQAVDDEHEPSATVRERVDGAHRVRYHVHFVLQLEYEAVHFEVVTEPVLFLPIHGAHYSRTGRYEQVPEDFRPRQRRAYERNDH